MKPSQLKEKLGKGEEVILLSAENAIREVPAVAGAETEEVSIPRRWWDIFFAPRPEGV